MKQPTEFIFEGDVAYRWDRKRQHYLFYKQLWGATETEFKDREAKIKEACPDNPDDYY